ncbi:TrkH family potassium uptake protein [Spiroplasma culicicola]|uniref:Potassium uptake protein KtrB n=1 Tax=Spiroplasma culicicola AES-1 TaxID=1276246 RepID=W6AFK4_9MOLU|nr:potassium transporter TrkG [Spiroplasma culicicola]AHI52474.1 potassium uptake protein KtrB [Spiroplasma culicicola AES-1]
MDNLKNEPNNEVQDKKRIKKRKRKLVKVKRSKSLDNTEKTFFAKLKSWWPLSKISGKIIIGYLSAIIIGGFLLSIPGIMINKEHEWNFITGIFTASSAISDTGINMVYTYSDYSILGQFLILAMIKIGGIGLLTFKIVLLVMFNKKVSLDDQSVAKTERGSGTLANTVEMIRDAFIFLTVVEILGSFALFFGFYFTPPGETIEAGTFVSPYQSFSKSLWYGIFHSISAVNNAGFDIIGQQSLMPYNQEGVQAYHLQWIFMIQWIIGGLGYPTYHDIKRKIKAKKEGKQVRFSLFTKLNFVVYLTLFLIGPLLVFCSEYFTQEHSRIMEYVDENNNSTERHWKPWYVWSMDIIFNVTSCRNAGFSTVDVNDFTAGSKFIMSIWMFIGSAPSSTAGGIRTTTFAICIIGIVSIMKNKHSVEAFKKKIPDETVKRSFAVVFLSMLIIMTSIFIVYLDSNVMLTQTTDGNEGLPQDSENTIIRLILYVCSAFGTVGFQPFKPDQIIQMGVLSKIALILTMFIGQLGISNTLLAFVKPKNKQNFGYLEEEVTIG